MTAPKREDKVIFNFCARLAALEAHPVEVIERPDKKNPGLPGCDAIIVRGSNRWALEHTSIDSFKGQREDDSKFEQFVVPLETRILQEFPDSYCRISVPVNAFQKGVEWDKLAKKLEIGCIEIIRNIPVSPDEVARSYQVPDVPFPVRICRAIPLGRPQCHVMRICPPNQKEELVENMVTALVKKDKQLQPYRKSGLQTVLLFDSDDPSLVNADSLAEAFSEAVTKHYPNYIDEVYIAENDRNPPWYYPVKLSGRIHPHLQEYREYFRRQYKLIYEEATIKPKLHD